MLPANLGAELLRPGELTVLAGRPGQGKTSLALQLAMGAVAKGRAAVVFSFKTAKGRLLKRLLCLESKIPLVAAMSEEIPKADRKRAASILKKFTRSPLHIFDSAASVNEILRLSRRVAAGPRKLSMIVIDHLQLISEIQDDQSAQNATKVVRALGALAKELETPMLLMSLVNRPADSVALIERDIKRVSLTIKRRDGRKKKFRLRFDRATGILSKP